VVEDPGGHTAPAELQGGQALLVDEHGRGRPLALPRPAPQSGGVERGFELGEDLVVAGQHRPDLPRRRFALGCAAPERRCRCGRVVGQAHPVDQGQRQLRVGSPRGRAQLPLVRAPEGPVLDEGLEVACEADDAGLRARPQPVGQAVDAGVELAAQHRRARDLAAEVPHRHRRAGRVDVSDAPGQGQRQLGPAQGPADLGQGAEADAGLQAHDDVHPEELPEQIRPGGDALGQGRVGQRPVGTAAVETAVHLDAQVIAVTSDPDMWNDHPVRPHVVLDRRAVHLREAMKAQFPDGIEVVLDPVGGDLAELAMRSLGPRGRYLVVGFASGQIPTLPANQILLRNRTVVGVEWATWITANPEHLARTLEVVLNRLARGVLHPPKPTLVDLDELPEVLLEAPPGAGLIRTVVVP
jgi:hypothetical protein